MNNFLPRTEQQKKLDDPEVKKAIRVLKSKGVTLEQIESVYKYYERLFNGREEPNVHS